MAGVQVYELLDRDDDNEFKQDLLDNANNGQVPIYLADIHKLVKEQGGSLDRDVIAVSIGKPIDPEELHAKVSDYHRQFVLVCPHVVNDASTLLKYEPPVGSDEGIALCAACAALGIDAVATEPTCRQCFETRVECTHKDDY